MSRAADDTQRADFGTAAVEDLWHLTVDLRALCRHFLCGDRVLKAPVNPQRGAFEVAEGLDGLETELVGRQHVVAELQMAIER